MKEEAQKELHDFFVEVIKVGFHYIKQQTQGKYLYSFALQLNNDGKSFRCVGNTLDSVSDKFMVELTSVEDVTDYLWFTTEWDYSFNPWKANAQDLQQLIEEKQPLLISVTTADFFHVLLESLQTCNSQWLFGAGILREKMSVFIDSEEGNILDLPEKTSQKLNPPYVHEAFLKRFEPNNPQGLTYRLINQLVSDY